jgi:hypothetical protein
MTVWREEEIEDLKKLACEGATFVRAAARLGRTTTAIKAKAKEVGVEFRNKQAARRMLGLDPRWSQNR